MDQIPINAGVDLPAIMMPSRLDSDAAPGLKDMLTLSPESALDGSEVTYLGGLCLQVILASERPVINASDKLSEALILFGATSVLQKTASMSESP
ncbi:hypothetical protein HW509_08725 [Asaia spathodeae]|uniref:hypothetical protein n=1 Tax=Asaia spathodeae TaxID=657016 RepID=UPI002FC3B7EB